MAAVETLRSEALAIESKLTDNAQRAQIRLHFDKQVSQLEPILQKLLLTQHEQQRIMSQHQQVIDRTAKAMVSDHLNSKKLVNPSHYEQIHPNVNFGSIERVP